jgi:hypothetical protein
MPNIREKYIRLTKVERTQEFGVVMFQNAVYHLLFAWTPPSRRRKQNVSITSRHKDNAEQPPKYTTDFKMTDIFSQQCLKTHMMVSLKFLCDL